MCKRNSPHKNKASTGCVRETHLIKKKKRKKGKKKRREKKKKKPAELKKKKEKRKKSQHGTCKRKSLDKSESSPGCVRVTPRKK